MGPRETPRVLNPLWIIALFLGLSETTVGVAAAQSDGWVQGLLAVFAVVFPLLVSATFFAILWQRPEVLYAPGDFPQHVPVSTYVDGMRRRSWGSAETLQEVVGDTLRQVLPAALEGAAVPAQSPRIVADALDSARRVIEARTLVVDLSAFLHEPGARYHFVAADSSTVRDLLDSVFVELRQFVRPFSYGREWILVDRRTGERLTDLGSGWADRHGVEADERLLRDVGLAGRPELAAERLAVRPAWWRPSAGADQVPGGR